MSGEGTLKLILDHVQRQGDEISDIKKTLVVLARVEERQQSQRDTLARYGTKIDELDHRVDELEKTSGNRGVMYRWLERIGLVGAGGVATKLIAAWPWGSH